MSAPSASGPVNFGKYQLVQRLGRGGMAEVWRARINGPGGFQRTLVVKRILPHLVEDPHFVRMFVDEARLSARLNHPNIVQVFELGDEKGEYFLAMEYVRGHDLINVVRACLPRGAPPTGMAAYVMRDVCRALGYAHALHDDNGMPLRLIDRDVTPSNIMLSFDGGVKLLDFGIAKALNEASDHKTQTGTLKGKFGYMAPEQVEGADFDHRADLFAAGVVLHESLTGRRLFKGTTDLQTIAKVRETKVPPPSELNPAVPPELDRIALKALAKRPEDRYRTCEEMAVDLDSVVHELKWGPEKLAATLKELFPDEPTNTGTLSMVAEPDEQHGSGVSIDTLRARDWRRKGAMLGGAVVVAGAIGWLVVANAFGPPLPPTATAPVAAVSKPKSAAPAAPPAAVEEPREVRVQVMSSPAGAEVFVDGESDSRGLTPLSLTLPRGEVQRRLVLKLKGYDSYSTDVLPDSNSRVELTLVKTASPRSSSHHSSGKVAKKGAASPSAGPDVRRGDVVDPFAH